MKHIILPIEKPEEAENILQYGFGWAGFLQAKLIILHIFRYHKHASSLIDLSGRIALDYKKEFEDRIRKSLISFPSGITWEVQVLEGEAVEMILDFANSRENSMILLPTKGKTSSERFFLGSVSNAILTDATVPLLLFHPSSRFTPPQRIAFPVDSEGFESGKILLPLLEIADQNKAKIMVFHLENLADDFGIHPSVDTMLGTDNNARQVSFHYELSDKPVTASINDFSLEYQADLICLIRRKKSIWDALTKTSITQQELREKVLPVLVLRAP